jgi:hypothetical protein
MCGSDAIVELESGSVGSSGKSSNIGEATAGGSGLRNGPDGEVVAARPGGDRERRSVILASESWERTDLR